MGIFLRPRNSTLPLEIEWHLGVSDCGNLQNSANSDSHIPNFTPVHSFRSIPGHVVPTSDATSSAHVCPAVFECPCSWRLEKLLQGYTRK
ncbi:hypothetical protein BD410DRAFT_791465 [Rickenella mellea]|uniref:Uncharacterized protein n=1 Tax=Rickenella mellea TaxID=50990 RepID=A0A4Y7PXF7_9AGAM|nr:hypothetical protein BD410DRAFT_791465 [Rickenella mellea]